MASQPSGAASTEAVHGDLSPGAAASAPYPASQTENGGHGAPQHGEGGKLGFHHTTLGLALGSIGVVFGDIGTSPLYAFQANPFWASCPWRSGR